MRVEISSEGVLLVTGENSTEDYALNKWYADNEGLQVRSVTLPAVEIQQGSDGTGLAFLNTAELIEQYDTEDEEREGVEE